ncbi:MAG TPA: hypothetical protein VG708_09410 [Mycobacteriales bacterium]|nr:hypothetical protein [Mycobacteriales bacterium]
MSRPMHIAFVTLLRLGGAAMLGATAGIHLLLYTQGYRTVPKIGALFLLTGVVGSVLCLAVLLPRGWLGSAVALAAAGFEVVTLAAILLSLERSRGIFNFKETWLAPHVTQSIWVECIGAVILTILAIALLPPLNRRLVAAVPGG